MAALQTRSQRVNCSGAVEPCLPYQEFAETTVARSSSLLREEGQSPQPGGGSVAPKQTLAVTGAKAILEGNRTDMPGDETVLDLSDGSSAGQFDEAWQSQLWKTMLPVELHIPSVSIEALLDEVAYGKAHIDFEGTFGKNESLLLGSGGRSIAELLQQLRAELSTTCEIPEHRLVMNSIHGRFIRPAAATSSPFQSYRGLFPVASSKSGSSFTTGLNQEERLGEEVLVRFFVSPGQASAENMDGEKKAVRKVVEHLQSALRNPRSSLMKGKLSKLLSQSSLTVGYQESYAYQAPQKIEKLSNLALPFVISAFFTGVLIWLASW